MNTVDLDSNSEKNSFRRERINAGHLVGVIALERVILISLINPWVTRQPLLRVRVRQGSEKLNPYPYPSVPYPKPARVLKPMINPTGKSVTHFGHGPDA